MRLIKTIIRPLDRAEQFDRDANKLISEGWTLTKRDLLNTTGEPSEAFSVPVVKILYAEFERRAPAFDEITL